MKKIAICAHFAEGKNLVNGQTIKSDILLSGLRKIYGEKEIEVIDTHNWSRNPFSLMKKCIIASYKCKNIIILPAQNGVKIFIPFFGLFKFLTRVKLHYVVIGGWLPKLVKDKYIVRKFLKYFDGIYVETHILLDELRKLNFNNLKHLPNFKELQILEEEDLYTNFKEPFKICIFSRVMEEKGVNDAIEVVRKINNKFGRAVLILDIYGPIEDDYKSVFLKAISNNYEYVKYQGIVDSSESQSVIKNYFLLLFPTKFKTEGVPGTIIDAYAAGVPVLASGWNSAKEVIDLNETGLIYDFNDIAMLEKLLIICIKSPEKVVNMKKNCLIKAQTYQVDVILNKFNQYLK